MGKSIAGVVMMESVGQLLLSLMCGEIIYVHETIGACSSPLMEHMGHLFALIKMHLNVIGKGYCLVIIITTNVCKKGDS